MKRIKPEIQTRIAGWKLVGAQQQEYDPKAKQMGYAYGPLQAFALINSDSVLNPKHPTGRSKRARGSAYCYAIMNVFDAGRINMIRTNQHGKQDKEDVYHLVLHCEKLAKQIPNQAERLKAEGQLIRARIAFAHANAVRNGRRSFNKDGTLNDDTYNTSFAFSFGSDRLRIKDVERFLRRIPFGMRMQDYAARLGLGRERNELRTMMNNMRAEIIYSAFNGVQISDDGSEVEYLIFEDGMDALDAAAEEALLHMKKKDFDFLEKIAKGVEKNSGLRTRLLYYVTQYRIARLELLREIYDAEDSQEKKKFWAREGKEIERLQEDLEMEMKSEKGQYWGEILEHMRQDLHCFAEDYRCPVRLHQFLDGAAALPGNIVKWSVMGPLFAIGKSTEVVLNTGRNIFEGIGGIAMGMGVSLLAKLPGGRARMARALGVDSSQYDFDEFDGTDY